MMEISNLAIKLREHRAMIAKSIEREDFDTAKRIKEQIDRIKMEIQEILESNNEEERAPQAEEEENEFAEATQDQNNNEFMEPQMQNYSSLPNSKVSNKQLSNSRSIKPAAKQEYPREDYDERVIPALRGDRIKS
jgi:hypothetical protein